MTSGAVNGKKIIASASRCSWSACVMGRSSDALVMLVDLCARVHLTQSSFLRSIDIVSNPEVHVSSHSLMFPPPSAMTRNCYRPSLSFGADRYFYRFAECAVLLSVSPLNYCDNVSPPILVLQILQERLLLRGAQSSPSR